MTDTIRTGLNHIHILSFFSLFCNRHTELNITIHPYITIVRVSAFHNETIVTVSHIYLKPLNIALSFYYCAICIILTHCVMRYTCNI